MQHYGAYYRKTRQASTPRGSDADLDYANAMVRATERHNRRRHREGQTQPKTIKHGSRISRKPRGCGYISKLVGIMGSGVDIVVLGVDISVLVVNGLGLSVDISVLVSNAPVLNVDIRIWVSSA